ncbi:MAG: alpha/beta hydrolase [Pleurocapsa sp.]
MTLSLVDLIKKTPTFFNSQYFNQLNLNLAIFLVNTGFCLTAFSLTETKTLAAEKIYLNYKALEFSLSIEALETYAKHGELQQELKIYANYLTPEQLEDLKIGLTTEIDLTPLAISQFLYSYQGEKILERLSKIIKTKARQPGFYAIRSALILAAADEESGGLTPLNVLKNFPTKAIRIDSERGFEIIENLSQIVQQNNQAIAAVEQKAIAEIEASKQSTAANGLTIPNLLQLGTFRYDKQSLILRDNSRDRRFSLDLYLPQPQTSEPLPLIVISHGLGSDRTTFDYLAKHLAAHGFAVAVPEHPGSDANQIQSLLTGLDDNVTPPEEFIDRPLDISFLLDRLETDYGRQIDVHNVGIIGQSFGAYTALALAGAKLNLEQLKQSCQNLDESWNISLLLQCLALELPPEYFALNLRDKRITAAIAINPVVSAVFGEAGMSRIHIPLTIISGSSDPITPALLEQIIPFTWLTNDNKYLALLKGGTHFSTLNESSGSIPVPSQAIGPNPTVAQNYIKQLGLAFFRAYIENNLIYQVNFNAKYANRINNPVIPLSLVRSLDATIFDLP